MSLNGCQTSMIGNDVFNRFARAELYGLNTKLTGVWCMKLAHTDYKGAYVGCGEDRRKDFLHIDKRNLPGIDVVCNAWEVSGYLQELCEIYSRHMLEHLTSMEAEATLHDWHNALAIGGQVYIVVPNIDFHIQQWLEADWNEETIRDPQSDARYGFAGLFGWQRQGNPRADDYEESYWDVHKSGYNKKRLKFLLERAGFVDIQLTIKNDVHLVAVAKKSMQKGERQISPELAGIRADHRNRYQFAIETLLPGKPDSVLDLACGIGYGSRMLQDGLLCSVTGVDIETNAIAYAKQHYANERTVFLEADARRFSCDSEFDAIVSFETIEHVDFDLELLCKFHSLLADEGTFICSTPNQSVMPFEPEKFRFHVRHYSVADIQSLLKEAGFIVQQVVFQDNQTIGKICTAPEGAFTILVCRKAA